MTDLDRIADSDSGFRLDHPVAGRPRGSILLVHGSAPFNLDGRIPGDPTGSPYGRTDFYRDLSNALRAGGWSVLRYSKPGVGPDGIAPVEYARTDFEVLARQLLEFWRLLPAGGPRVVFAWSEGSLHVRALPLEEIDAVVLLGGIATNIGDVVLARGGPRPGELRRELAGKDRREMMGFDMPVGRMLDELDLEDNWKVFARRPDLPMLVLHGTADREVPVAQAAIWKERLPGRPIRVVEGKDLDHRFMPKGAYDVGPLAREVKAWLDRVAKRARREEGGPCVDVVRWPLSLPPDLAGRRGEIAAVIGSACRIVEDFAARCGWQECTRTAFFDAVEIFEDQGGLWRRIREVLGLPQESGAPLPAAALSAALEGRVLMALAPEAFASVAPDYAAARPDAWARLLAHEMIHRLHVAILGGDEDAMGPRWFFEGFAILGASQGIDDGLEFRSGSEALASVTGGPEAGSYRRYAAAFRYFADRHPLAELVRRAGNPDFEQWLLAKRSLHALPVEALRARLGAGGYRAPSLNAEGFIHCTDDPGVLLNILDANYRDEPGDFIALAIDLERTGSPWRYDDVDRLFPHVFGPIGTGAIAGWHSVARDAEGRFTTVGPFRVRGEIADFDYAAEDRAIRRVLAAGAEAGPSAAPAASIAVVSLEAEDRSEAEALLVACWGSSRVVTRGRVHEAARLPGFVVREAGRLAGLATYRVEGGECELVTLDSLVEDRGIGSALVAAVEVKAREAGCTRLWLVTTNDNLRALRFYQRRGWRIAAVRPGAVDAARALKPEIPALGNEGIPIRDEIEMDKVLS